KKKPYRKELSQEQRSRIIGAYLCGFKPLHIAQALGFPKSTVYDTVNWYNETGSEHPSKCPSHQKVLSERQHLPPEPPETKKRKKWCYEHLKWKNEWQTVIFSDKSRECINTTVKYGGGSVMFWGCFSWWGVGPLVEVKGNMNSDSYVNVLANHFVPWANSLLEKYPDEIDLIF
ncbi:18988_t:CDS:2, partial [Gigaspora margarita]